MRRQAQCSWARRTGDVMRRLVVCFTPRRVDVVRRQHACPVALFISHWWVSMCVLGLQNASAPRWHAVCVCVCVCVCVFVCVCVCMYSIVCACVRLLRTSPPGTNVSISAPESARHMIVSPTLRSPLLLDCSLLESARPGAAGDCERLAGIFALRCCSPDILSQPTLVVSGRLHLGTTLPVLYDTHRGRARGHVLAVRGTR